MHPIQVFNTENFVWSSALPQYAKVVHAPPTNFSVLEMATDIYPLCFDLFSFIDITTLKAIPLT